MGSLIEFPGSDQARRPASRGLAPASRDEDSTGGRKAVVQIGELTTVCVVAEIPVVGDVVHGNVSAVVESVRITRDGIVRVVGRPTDPQAAVAHASPVSACERSSRMAGVLAEMRRRRLLRDNLPGRSADHLLEGA